VHLWEQQDPLKQFRARLFEAGVFDQASWETMEREVAAEISDAVAFAAAGTNEPVEQLTRFLYAEEPEVQLPQAVATDGTRQGKD
jgi:TPP-dependent pyruvate/acetoin dehydrogenase alpha subunit